MTDILELSIGKSYCEIISRLALVVKTQNCDIKINPMSSITIDRFISELNPTIIRYVEKRKQYPAKLHIHLKFYPISGGYELNLYEEHEQINLKYKIGPYTKSFHSMLCELVKHFNLEL